MPVSTSLRGRIPGQGVIGDIVLAQQDVPRRSRLARFFGFSPLTNATRSLYRAALGEQVVAETLDQLGPRWDILHVVPLVDADTSDEGAPAQIDHLVIGPPGVFAITTQNLPAQEVRVVGDAMTVGGKSTRIIPTARRFAELAAARLGAAAGRPVRVEAVVVVIDASRLAQRVRPDGVTVITSRQLVRYLFRLERELAGEEIAAISDYADRDATWGCQLSAPDDATQLGVQFAALRDQVQEAVQARVFWVVVAFGIVCVSAWAGTALIVNGMFGQ